VITGLIDRDLSEKAVISCDAILGEAVELMDSIGYGMLVSLDQNRVVKGVFTDGDFRRSVRLNNKPIASSYD
jgi:predicted transcriptional regulator